MSESKIVWHKYPKDKPPKSGRYLVTVILECMGIKVTTDDFYDYKEICENYYGGPRYRWYYHNGEVIAWAYTPEPFEEKKNG